MGINSESVTKLGAFCDEVGVFCDEVGVFCDKAKNVFSLINHGFKSISGKPVTNVTKFNYFSYGKNFTSYR